MNKTGVIIVAGGSGKRMKAGIPKQFIDIGGKPVLQHTIECFTRWLPGIEMVVVLGAGQIPEWEKLARSRAYAMDYRICAGGKERFHSVKNGLGLLGCEIVMVHDGVRPLVSSKTLDRCLAAVQETGSAVPVIPPVESVRRLTTNGSEPVSRDELRLVQTPQCFRREWIEKAYSQPYSTEFTDDASVVQSAGFPIRLTEGNRENIKITTPDDLRVAGIYLTT